MWASAFHDGWTDIGDPDSDRNVGVASYGAPVNWDSAARLTAVEAQGIVAEVLFPNTVPPFFPSGMVSAPAPAAPPTNRRAYELRFAGLRAHNRWLADFCRELPGRRAGLAQIFLSDVDDSVADVELAAELGLGGVLLPGDHHDQLQHLYHRRLDPVWAACCETGLPVGRHGVFVTRARRSGELDVGRSDRSRRVPVLHPAGARRGLVLSGVFERFPSLRFADRRGRRVVGAGIPRPARRDGARTRGGRARSRTCSVPRSPPGSRCCPSEYFQTNCFVGTFLDRHDMGALRHDRRSAGDVGERLPAPRGHEPVDAAGAAGQRGRARRPGGWIA